MAPSLELDHLVVSAVSLAEGAEFIEKNLGVTLSGVGRHDHMGTHNRLLSLGPSIYLEVIAIDPAAPKPGHARWFNLDAFDETPRLTHWACRTNDLDGLLAVAPDGTGTSVALERDIFKWRFAVPQNGKHPFDGAMPALLQWDTQHHPAPLLEDVGIRLRSLDVLHPDAEALEQAFSLISDLDGVQIARSETPRLRAAFDTPDGVKELT